MPPPTLGAQGDARSRPITDPSHPWFGYSPQMPPSTEESTRPSQRKVSQKGSRIRSKSRNALAESSSWERDQVPVRAAIGDSSPRRGDAVQLQIGRPTTDADSRDLMKVLQGCYQAGRDGKWQLRRFARTTPEKVGEAMFRLFAPPSTVADPTQIGWQWT